jgi:hypothetical protein
MDWLAPEVEVTIGEQTSVGSLHQLQVVAARSQPVATAFVALSNVRFEWNAGAADGDALVLRWGYRGHDLAPLFDGTVMRAHLRETLKVWGLCRARALADARFTRTYQDEQAGAVVQHLVQGMGFSSLDTPACETLIDKLPLRNSTAVDALAFLNRRLELDRAFYADAEGGFHWAERDTTQEPAAVFTYGEDILDLQSLPGNRLLLTAMGTPVWHSQVVSIVDRAQQQTQPFAERVEHLVGVAGVGARSRLWLEGLDG